MKSYIPIALSLLAAAGGASGTPIEECPIFGPSFPASFDISKSKPLQTAKTSFPEHLNALFSEGYLNRTHTAFAIDVFSTTTNASVFSYYHTGSGLQDAPTKGNFTEDTISRIGSVSKLLTVYAILAKGGYDVFHEPVTKYLPELSGNEGRSSLENVHWEDVTIGALAAQQGGTGGVPVESTQCFEKSGDCSNDEFLKIMKSQKTPVAPVFQTALYSDSGFAILGRVLERMTKKSYNDALQSALAEPLGLNSTSTYKSFSKSADTFIMPGNSNTSSFGYDNQVVAPSGGIYTNIADLRAIGLSILNSEILPPVTTRRWMKPHGSTESAVFLVGAPWEINRLQIPVSAGSDRTRLSELYTKMGANVGYSSAFALSPDHGLGFSVLSIGATAGDDRFTLRDIVGSVFLPAAETAASENAADNFVGIFVDEKDEQSNITLVVDEGRPGIKVKSLYEDGMDTRSTVRASPVTPKGAQYVVRLYPTNSSPANAMTSSNSNIKISFRATREALPYKSHTKPGIGRGIFGNDCISWFMAGFAEDIDEFVLELVDGKVQSVTRSVTGTVMNRVDN